MESSLDNIIGNIILFMPLGLVVPVLFKKVNSIGKITLVGMASSVFIETMQFILRQFKIYRTVDIDDVILNVAGTLAGYFIYTLVVKMTANKRSLQNKALCLF